MKPRIGISMNYHVVAEGIERAYLDMPYFSFVEEIGGLAFPICPTDNVLQLNTILGHVDGVLFTGGLDLDSMLWEENLHRESHLVHPRRQRFELMLYEQAQKRELPILALCFGMQMINVAQGGSLHQHLPDLDFGVEVDHGSDEGMSEHVVNCDLGSHLFDWTHAEQFKVNSGHHQGINNLGDRLQAVAVAEDGLIEAFERNDYPFLLGVQWHPERNLANPINRTIMDEFLKASDRK
jgi:putative glutamine amidotransferase